MPSKQFPSEYKRQYDSIVFDLGDVLFTWSPSTPESPLPAKVMRDILRSVHWFEYEKGNLTEEEAYGAVAVEINVPPADVKGAFDAARDSLQSNPRLLQVISELRQSGVAVYAMSNISAPDWNALSKKATPREWKLFDRVFTSAGAHERKPNIGFYTQVIENTGINPFRTIFVDDKIENVVTAQSLGMYGIVFDNQEKAIQKLQNLCGNPIDRGYRFLVSNKKRHYSFTVNGVQILENFAQLLLLEGTGDRSLVNYVKHTGQFNFFQSGGVLTTRLFPNDLDTTSIGLTIADHIDEATTHKVMNEMLEYRNQDGIIQVYFDHARPRIGMTYLLPLGVVELMMPSAKDPVVCVNVLNLFYKYNRGHELLETLRWVEQVLENRAYIAGTYYYASADLFLFFLARLMQTSSEMHHRLRPVFIERVRERLGGEADSLSLAARIIAASVVDIVAQRDLETLLLMQTEDGSWKDGWFYKYGSSGTLIGNDGVTTAFAMRAIQQVEKLRKVSCAASAGPAN